jgi:hypothetical protein
MEQSMKKFIGFSASVLFMLASLFGALLVFPSRAQQDPMPLPTEVQQNSNTTDITPTAAPTDIASVNAVIRKMFGDYYAQFTGRTLEDYRVAYLVTPESIESISFFDVDTLLEAIPSLLVASSWQEVMQLEQESPLHGLVIHASAYPWVDTQWTQNAYARGVVITVVDMTFKQRADVTGDKCEFPLTPATENGNPFTWNKDYDPEKGSVVISSYWALRVTNEADRWSIAQRLLHECGKDDGLPYLGIGSGVTNEYIVSEEKFNQLPGIILSDLVQVEAYMGRGEVEARIDMFLEEMNRQRGK